MKILITGGGGYIGTRLVKSLILEPTVEQVVVYDNLSKGHYNFFLGDRFINKEKIKFVQGDILDSRLLKQSLKDMNVVVHMAAIVTTPFANVHSHFFEQVNHWGTAEVVYAAEETGINKFIYMSSTSVYGNSNQEVNENTVPQPATFYGISKLRGEEHVDRLKEKKNTICIRSGNVYGYSRSMRFDAVINRFMFDANFINRIYIDGNGKQSRAFIHADYLIDTIIKTITQEVSSGTYNVVDKNLQILDLVAVVKEICPSVEFLFTNQHINLRELKVSRKSKLYNQIERFKSRDIKTELLEFKTKFSY